ncbi:J domain-containing protein [Hathewaya histolytica]|uniref:DnaJ-class molecular chaperone with C-terminal Zn finger domain n=1 Tax=Hathewaya histolytica TaxID=1498 RepID=A0A4V6KCJ8_HATHI|nr:J domain-containing protein [Hathewaya histolytica]VTQ84937.1 DnaJ-class molecular chaperone with C-terminal Zn finger domain [Hathewaya histolytica]
MRDPYEVLEVRKGSSKDEIKNAYKRLAKQYHPDQFDNNPLRDLAEERMREINEAYDYLMKNVGNNSYGSNDFNDYNRKESNSSYSNKSVYETVRMDINQGNYASAEQKLNSMAFKDAEWNYLMGTIYMKKGWYDSANNYITTAYNLNPANSEYRTAFNQMNNQAHNYRQTYYGKNSKDNDMCDLCVKLWCADTLCECMGGDLISCF